MCCLCGIRWKGSRFYLQFIPRAIRSDKAGDGESPSDELGAECDELCALDGPGIASSATI